MYNEGFGSNGSAYEYTVAKEGRARSTRKLALLLLYVAWIVIFFSVGMLTRILLPLLCFIPLSLWILVFLTWRFTKEEVKLGFFSGSLTVTRLFDGKNPKVLLETKLKDITAFGKHNDEAPESFEKKTVILALKDGFDENTYIAETESAVLFFEANEKALKIIEYYCDAAKNDR